MPSISGLASGMDTQEIIQKLVKLESKPIKRLENEIKQRKREQKAWNKVLQSLKKLESKSKTLYSFDNPFGQKMAESSAPGIIKAKANGYAEPMDHNLRVLQRATQHRISSDAMDKSQQIKSGNFTLKVDKQKEQIYFPGGSIQELFNLLYDKARSVVSSSLIKKSQDVYVMTLESKKSGRDGAIDVEDPDGLLRSIGIHKVRNKENRAWALGLEALASGQKKQGSGSRYQNVGKGYNREDYWFWQQKDLWQLQKDRTKQGSSQSGQQSTKQKSAKDNTPLLTLKGKNRLHFPVKDLRIDEESRLVLRFRPDYVPDKAKGRQKIKKQKRGEREIAVAPSHELNVGGNELKTPGLTRKENDFSMLREEMAGRDVRGQKKKDKDDPSEQKISGFVHINLADGNSKKIPYSAPPLSLRHRNPGYKAPMQKINKALVTLKDKKIESIELEHKSGVASVYQLAVESPDEKIPPRFKNELAAAQDAKIEYGGVIVSREKNTDLTDLIKGLTLELKGASDEHVTITVRVDVERAQKAINEFLEQYNKFLSLADRLSVQAKEKNLGKYDRQKKKSGVLSGDSTLNRLVTELQRMASSAYPNKTGKDKKKTIRVLYQIGISTGKIGGSIQKSMRGRLEIIDQQKLVKQLRDNHEAVEEFFGSDTTGNKQVNHGLAFRMWTYLRHYTRRGRSGMITVKINMTEKRIENTRKRIRKLERHVAMYKKRLKRSFQAMEQGMLQLKSERRWLQNQMKGLSGGGGGSKGKVNLND